jgi:hypothetical protein
MFNHRRLVIPNRAFLRALAAGGFSMAVAYSAAAQGGFFGGGVQPDVPLVKQFDKDADKRLNATERKAARAYINANGGVLPGRRGVEPNRRADVKPGPSMTPSQAPVFAAAPLYDAATLRTVFLQFDSTDWEDELVDFYHTDVEVPATVILDGNTYRDVGVHFRGNSSFRMVPEASSIRLRSRSTSSTRISRSAATGRCIC